MRAPVDGTAFRPPGGQIPAPDERKVVPDRGTPVPDTPTCGPTRASGRQGASPTRGPTGSPTASRSLRLPLRALPRPLRAARAGDVGGGRVDPGVGRAQVVAARALEAGAVLARVRAEERAARVHVAARPAVVGAIAAPAHAVADEVAGLELSAARAVASCLSEQGECSSARCALTLLESGDTPPGGRRWKGMELIPSPRGKALGR